MIIYKITNKINGKIYIGQTTRSLQHRWRKHCESTSGCTALSSAIKKYDKENFTVEQIDVATTREELDQKESYWIAYYDSMSPNGYNLTGGGDRPCEVSEETRMKRRIANLGKKMSEEACKKMSLAKKGTKLSEERKNKLRECSRKWWSIPENRARMCEINKANMTPERREAISKFHKGRKRSPETVEKLRLANTGKKCSEETKAKLRAFNLGKKLSPEIAEKIGKGHWKRVICIETGEVFCSVTEAGNRYKVGGCHISSVCRGKRKTAGGFTWRYVDE